MVTHHALTDADFEKLPAKKPAKPSQWETILEELAAGKAVGIPYDEEKQLKGYRIGLARAAATKGIKLEFRADARTLGVRKSVEPYVPKPKAEGAPRRGRERAAERDGA